MLLHVRVAPLYSAVTAANWLYAPSIWHVTPQHWHVPECTYRIESFHCDDIRAILSRQDHSLSPGVLREVSIDYILIIAGLTVVGHLEATGSVYHEHEWGAPRAPQACPPGSLERVQPKQPMEAV